MSELAVWLAARRSVDSSGSRTAICSSAIWPATRDRLSRTAFRCRSMPIRIGSSARSSGASSQRLTCGVRSRATLAFPRRMTTRCSRRSVATSRVRSRCSRRVSAPRRSVRRHRSTTISLPHFCEACRSVRWPRTLRMESGCRWPARSRRCRSSLARMAPCRYQRTRLRRRPTPQARTHPLPWAGRKRGVLHGAGACVRTVDGERGAARHG